MDNNNIINPIAIIAEGGDGAVAPRYTLVALWAALAAGADGLALAVHSTQDGTLVCYSHSAINSETLNNRPISQLNYRELANVDAGALFRPVSLDDTHQPDGTALPTFPWKTHPHKHDALQMVTLEEVLQLFSRRTRLYIVLPADTTENWQTLIDNIVAMLTAFGVEKRVDLIGSTTVCTYLKQRHGAVSFIIRPQPRFSPTPANIIAWVEESIRLGANALNIPVEWVTEKSPDGNIVMAKYFVKVLDTTHCAIVLSSHEMKYCLTPAYYQAIDAIAEYVEAIFTAGVSPTVTMGCPPGRVIADPFSGTSINRRLWSAGYSHTNQETTLDQDEGLIITLAAGKQYSGGGIVSLIPIHGPFDARVAFSVSAPAQGTTFEMAAIAVDPGYFSIDHNDKHLQPNLCFDVHGAPPYASTECDENDGFRCGWNNGFSLTRVDTAWQAASVNMYNQYGRDVGEPVQAASRGELRLIRNGAVFASFYRVSSEQPWVCCGAMLVPSLGSDIHIRLAAKHWDKNHDGNAPTNVVTFHEFQLYQY